jgi:hypothetical protein
MVPAGHSNDDIMLPDFQEKNRSALR